MEKNYLEKIEGLCACYNKDTLNGRGYDKIYRNILEGNDYRFNAMMQRGGIPCEFGHPAQVTADFERTETDPERICAIIKQIEEGEDGKIYAKEVIIPDTPSGKIFKALRPHYNFGFSSRGSYDAVDEDMAEGPDGWNQDSYVFKGFDIVILPANEESVISATESVKGKSKKKAKSARESLDLNAIAEATDLAPEDIEKELDKMFDSDGDVEGAELIDMRTLDSSKEPLEEPDSTFDENLLETENETPETPEVQSDIINDLQTALTEASNLRQDLERCQFELEEAKSNIVSRDSRISILEMELEKLRRLEQDYSKIKAISAQLVDSYHGVKNDFESSITALKEEKDRALEQNEQLESEAKNLAVERDETRENLRIAQEQLSKANSRSSVLATELKSAKESILAVYSSTYGVDKSQLQKVLGSNFKISQVKSAVESIVNDTMRMSDFEVQEIKPSSVIKGRPVKEQLVAQDIYDEELIEALLRD